MEFIKIKFEDGLESHMERSLSDIFGTIKPVFSLRERAWSPQMDIYETHEEIFIRAEIAGVSKENLEVEVNSKAVRVFGQRNEQPRVQNASYRLAEIQYGRFERILLLPSPIDTEVVSASYQNGFLEIRLAKLPFETTRKVPVFGE